MNILEDLWFGNISPWERPFKKDSAYAELLALVVRHQEALLSRLNDEEEVMTNTNDEEYSVSFYTTD